LTDRIAFRCASRAARYQGVGETRNCCWASAEHIAESEKRIRAGSRSLDAVLDVTEPMGMETLIFSRSKAHKSAGGLIPTPALAMAGRFDAVDLNNMHPAKRGHRRRI